MLLPGDLQQTQTTDHSRPMSEAYDFQEVKNEPKPKDMQACLQQKLSGKSATPSLFRFDYVMAPVCRNDHRVLLVADIQGHSIHLFDSMAGKVGCAWTCLHLC